MIVSFLFVLCLVRSEPNSVLEIAVSGWYQAMGRSSDVEHWFTLRCVFNGTSLGSIGTLFGNTILETHKLIFVTFH